MKENPFSSFELLYKKYSDRLYNFVMKVSKGDTHLAEEIVQDTFIKIWEIRDEIDPEKSFSSYLFTICKNKISNHYQHYMLEILYKEQVQKLLENGPEVNSTEKELEYKLLEEYIRILINQLPPERRKIYQLSRESNLNNKEIAALLNISENTVESQLYKALSFLRKKITDHYEMN